MKCPRCVQQIHRAAVLCPHCGFRLEDADALFGNSGRNLALLSDQAGIFRHSERYSLENMLAGFHAQFPQLFLAVHTDSAGDSAYLRQFGFWILNRCTFEGLRPEQSSAAGILIVIDPDLKSASMSFGYLLDAVLTEQDTFECLTRGHSYWLKGQYAEGLLRCVEHLRVLLRQRSRQACRRAKKLTKHASGNEVSQ
jgi:uncharacterized membrane protein YgcG